MKENGIVIPWNARIRQTVKTFVEQIGLASGVPLHLNHVPTEENLSNSLACTEDLSAHFSDTQDVRIGNSVVFLVKGFSARGKDDPALQAALQLTHRVLKEYLQGQAEVESFSREILDNYQTINMLYKISEALGNIQDVRRVSSIILNQAVAITHAERGSVFLLEGDGKTLQVAASYGFTPQEMEEMQSLSLSLSDTLCSKTLETGKPLIVEDIKQHPDLAVYSRGVYKTGSFISIPLQAGGEQQQKRLLGVLNLADKATAESFKSNDLKLLSALTAQASIAIANAQTLTELNRSREALKKTVDELTHAYEHLEKRAVIIDQINKISLAISSTLDLDSLFDKIQNYAKNLTSAEDAMVYYKRIPAHPEKTPEALAGLTDYPRSEWENLFSFSEVLQSGRIMALEGPGQLPNVGLQNGTGVRIRDLLVVPFFNKGEAIGFIAVANKIHSQSFTGEDQELLKTLGNQAAVAVENALLISEQKFLLLNAIRALAAAVDAKDPYTHNHSRNVSIYSRMIAEEMGLSDRDMETLELAAVLHDIGKIAIPEAILNKPERLTAEEFKIMKTHPLCGVKIVEGIPEMEAILPAMKYHHERFDGKGYPEGLKGEEIPLMARIMAVADTYDAITSDRPYRKGPGHEFAVEEIKRCSGSQFCPEAVEAFFRSAICGQRAQEFAAQGRISV